MSKKKLSNVCSNEEYQIRRTFGLKHETEQQETIERIIGCKLKRSKNKYCKYDYKGLGVKVELKSRRIYSTDYETTIINNSKLEDIKEDEDYYLFFKFLDCMKYIRYNKEVFNENCRIGYNKKLNPNYLYCYIPIGIMETA